MTFSQQCLVCIPLMARLSNSLWWSNHFLGIYIVKPLVHARQQKIRTIATTKHPLVRFSDSLVHFLVLEWHRRIARQAELRASVIEGGEAVRQCVWPASAVQLWLSKQILQVSSAQFKFKWRTVPGSLTLNEKATAFWRALHKILLAAVS